MGSLKAEEEGRDNHHHWLWLPDIAIRLHCCSIPTRNFPYRVVHCYNIEIFFFFRTVFSKTFKWWDTWVVQLKCITKMVGISFTSMKRRLLLPKNYYSNIICHSISTISQHIRDQKCWVPEWKGRAVRLRSWRASWLSQLSWKQLASETAGKTLPWGQMESHLKQGPRRWWF